MTYTRIHRSKNHQLFLNEHGKVVIADQSGTNPDETDDGPLIVAPDAVVLVQYSADYGLTFRVPVLVARSGSDGNVVTLIPEDFRALHRQLPNLRVRATESFTRTYAQLAEVWPLIANSRWR